MENVLTGFAIAIKAIEEKFAKKNTALIIAVEMDIVIIATVIVIKTGLVLHVRKLLAQMTVAEMEYALRGNAFANLDFLGIRV